MVSRDTKTTLLERLGLSTTEIGLVVHLDDIGMCHATVDAFARILESGRKISGSIMATSPWLPLIADICAREHPDVGVHLTLNSEWSAHRFRPIEKSPSLLDKDGFFFRFAMQTSNLAQLSEALAELRAQISSCQALGIELSHIDSHMLTLWDPIFIQMYLDLAREFRLECVLPRASYERVTRLCNYSDSQGKGAFNIMSMPRNARYVHFDDFIELPLVGPSNRALQAKALIDSLSPGLYFLSLHPATDSAELRAVADDWRTRVQDFELLMNPTWLNERDPSNVRIITMQEIRKQISLV